MFDDLSGYFYENVIATFKEYKDQRENFRGRPSYIHIFSGKL
jgi:hypothetical protein